MRFPIAVVLLALALLAGCARAPDRHDHGWAAESARRHAQADAMLRAGRRADAVRVLTELRDSLRRQHVATTAGGRMALQDVYYRLGDLSLQAGAPETAIGDCDEGLAIGAFDDVFTANLLVVRGTAHERLRHDAAAAEDLHHAMLINEKLLGQTLDKR